MTKPAGRGLGVDGDEFVGVDMSIWSMCDGLEDYEVVCPRTSCHY